MKIAILTDSFFPYTAGISTYTFELVKELIIRGHEVLIIAPNNIGDNSVPRGIEKAKIIRLRSIPTMIKGLRICMPNPARVISELRKFKAELVEIEDPLFLGLDGLLSSKILGIPCISVFHTLATSKYYLRLIFRIESGWLKKASWLYHQKFYSNSDKVFVFTTQLQRMLIRQGVNKNIINIIPHLCNFKNIKLLDNTEKKVLKKFYGLNGKLAVYVGRISIEKNLDTLIKIWKGVIEKYPKATLMIIGKGAYEKELKKIIQAEKLDSKVKMLGFIEHDHLMSSGILSICDVFVATSTSETFGLTGLEAMAHKLPVVLFKSQGLAEVIDDAGMLIKPNDKKSFENAILTLFKDGRLRKSLAYKSQTLALSYDSKVSVKKIVKLYMESIKNHKPRVTSYKYLKELYDKFKENR